MIKYAIKSEETDGIKPFMEYATEANWNREYDHNKLDQAKLFETRKEAEDFMNGRTKEHVVKVEIKVISHFLRKINK